MPFVVVHLSLIIWSLATFGRKGTHFSRHNVSVKLDLTSALTLMSFEQHRNGKKKGKKQIKQQKDTFVEHVHINELDGFRLVKF